MSKVFSLFAKDIETFFYSLYLILTKKLRHIHTGVCFGRNLAILRKLKFISTISIPIIVCCLIVSYTQLISHSHSAVRNLFRKRNQGYGGYTQMTLSKKIHIVTQFPVIINGSQKKLINQRQQEYIKTLKNNLQHPQVEKIHLLLERHEDIKFLDNSTIQVKSEKIYYYSLNRRMLYGDAFRYVSRFLLNKTSIIMNADCYLGNGFQKLKIDILRKGTIYALTRHEAREAITNCGVKDLCSTQAKYIGSHDAFVMNLKKPLPSTLLDTLMVRQDIVGVENFVIFILRKLGKFNVKNPCGILFIFHNHCTKFRDTKRRFVHGKRFNQFYLPNVPRWKTNAPFSEL